MANVYRLNCCGELAWVVADSAESAWSCAIENAFHDGDECGCRGEPEQVQEIGPDVEVAIYFDAETDAREDYDRLGGDLTHARCGSAPIIEQTGASSWRVVCSASAWAASCTTLPAYLCGTLQ